MSQASYTLACESFADGLRPEPDISVSEWAEQNRVLVQTSSAEPGKWHNDRTPYLVEIMDCLSPWSGIVQVSVMKGAQGGFTEAGNNWIGAIIDRFPGPTLYVQPTVDTVKRYSQIRLSPMIAACPRIANKVSDGKSRTSSNTIFLKEFPGGALILGGANSAVALRSMPIRFLFMDEVDAYPLDVDGEGDPIALAEKRTTTFRNRKILKISTPTLVGLSHIEKDYFLGDQRQWWVPCPYCSKRFVMRWKMTPEDDDPGGLIWTWGEPSTAHYRCPHCLTLIPEFQKTQMNIEGTWIPLNPLADKKIRSYHWPSLYSPYGWPGSSWPELAKKWEQGHRDPTQVKVFMNAELGLPYEDQTTRRADPGSLLARCEPPYPQAADGATVTNDGIAVVTIGADVQPTRIEFEICGWGKGEESWSLGRGTITGDTSTFVPFKELERVLQGKFRTASGVPLTVHATCVDSNFNTQTVTAWAGPLFHRRIWAVRGQSGRRGIWPKLPGKTKYNNTPLFTVGVDAAKEAIVSRLNIVEPGPGYSHFPDTCDEDFFEQLTSEVCVTLYDKSPPYNVWRKKAAGIRNEALDCRVYAYAGLCGLLAGGLRLDVEAGRVQVEAEKRQSQLAAVKPPTPQRGAVRFSMRG